MLLYGEITNANTQEAAAATGAGGAVATCWSFPGGELKGCTYRACVEGTGKLLSHTSKQLE